jgi:hypothetical protein
MTSFRALAFEMEALGFEHTGSESLWDFYLPDELGLPAAGKRWYRVVTTARGRFLLAWIFDPGSRPAGFGDDEEDDLVVTLHEDEIERLREDMVREASDGLAP